MGPRKATGIALGTQVPNLPGFSGGRDCRKRAGFMKKRGDRKSPQINADVAFQIWG